jgi:hypothetical protein
MLHTFSSSAAVFREGPAAPLRLRSCHVSNFSLHVYGNAANRLAGQVHMGVWEPFTDVPAGPHDLGEGAELFV